ncbi:uncharacterized protein LOC118419420 [Branchiostoma floridae]|uniref:Uncharacterized protein LOC118419420 n=1 Tax=Branchiostoma floridae TaxID=7739 RepID=A0A9J7MVP3_BRAFL|nr:uncharacterized protein LOC118419420 [Branchiostoma floridae]
MSYSGSCVLGLGWTLIVLGSLSVILGISATAAFVPDNPYFTFHKIGAPIWSGILVIITGIVGVFSGKSPTNKGLMAAFLPLSIFVILVCFACWAVSAAGIAVDGISCVDCAAMRALHGVNLLLGFTEMVLGFVTSIMSCVGMCSSNNVQPVRAALSFSCLNGLIMVDNTLRTRPTPRKLTVIYHTAAPLQTAGGMIIMQNTAGAYGAYPMHTSGVTYVGGGVQQPVVFQPQPTGPPPAYSYVTGPVNPAMVVHSQAHV